MYHLILIYWAFNGNFLQSEALQRWSLRHGLVKPSSIGQQSHKQLYRLLYNMILKTYEWV